MSEKLKEKNRKAGAEDFMNKFHRKKKKVFLFATLFLNEHSGLTIHLSVCMQDKHLLLYVCVCECLSETYRSCPFYQMYFSFFTEAQVLVICIFIFGYFFS